MSDPSRWLEDTPRDETPRKGNEHSLHLLLKEQIAIPGDLIEAKIGRYKADILRENLVIEIQTRSLASMRRKAHSIMKNNPLRVVMPIHCRKYIVKLDENGDFVHRRKSPKRQTIFDIFEELMHVPELLLHPDFQLELIFLITEEVRIQDGKGSWHRKGQSIIERGLLEITDRRVFTNRDDYISLIPTSIRQSFTTTSLAKRLNINVRLARKVGYTFFKAGIAERIGKDGNAHIYQIL